MESGISATPEKSMPRRLSATDSRSSSFGLSGNEDAIGHSSSQSALRRERNLHRRLVSGSGDGTSTAIRVADGGVTEHNTLESGRSQRGNGACCALA
jgi:hypothetical protein